MERSNFLSFAFAATVMASILLSGFFAGGENGNAQNPADFSAIAADKMENSISATSVSVPERNGELSGPEAAFVSPRSEELTEAALAGAAPVGKLFSEKNASLPLRDSGVENPDVGAAAAAAFDIESGYVLFSYNGERRWPTASLVKLLTAVVAIEKIGEDSAVAVSERAVASEGLAGGLKAGERYPAGDLIKLMLAASSNDAAFALAEHYGYENFIAAMREKTAALEMRNTFVSDPTGLSVLNQSTPPDLEKLVIYILIKHPQIFDATRRQKITVREIGSGTKKTAVNINLFAGRSDFLGGKTGYTDESGGNLASLFALNGRRILFVVFGAADRFGETERMLSWIKKAYNFN